jgi:hypothetical protein
MKSIHPSRLDKMAAWRYDHIGEGFFVQPLVEAEAGCGDKIN